MTQFQSSGFSIELPDKCIDASSYTFVLTGEEAGDVKNYAPNITIRFENAAVGFDLKKSVNDALDVLRKQVEAFELISQDSGKRGENDGIMTVYEWGKGVARMRQKQVVLLVPGEKSRKYILTTTDLASQADKSDPVFDQILRSFEVLT